MYHRGKDYEEVDRMALRIRCDYGHFDKFLDVFLLAEQLNIELIKYSSLTEKQLEVISSHQELKDGFTVFIYCDGEYKFKTYYNDKMNIERIRLTIAHEIKHVIYLEKEPTKKDEDLANHFARYLLAPTCAVVPYVDHFNITAVADDFGLSIEAASNAYNAAETKIKANKTPLKKYEQEFMNEYKDMYSRAFYKI